MPARAVCVPVILALLGHGEAAAEPTISETIKYYSVSGWDIAAIRKDMDKRRPTDGSGAPRDAVTTSNVRWRLTMKSGEEGCAVARVSVTATIVITLPKLVAPRLQHPTMSRGGRTGSGLDSETLQNLWVTLLKDFSGFQQRLLAHEQRHSSIGAESARQIEAGLLALPPAADCDSQRAAADAAAGELLAEAAQRNLNYDIATQHGAAEGIRFPP